MMNLFNWLLIFNIFSGGFVLFSSQFEFYLGYIFIIFFLVAYIFRYRNLSINYNFFLVALVLTISSLINVYLGNDTLILMLKQVWGILITGSAYYLLIKNNNYEIEKLFKIYLRIALIVAIIGIFQELSFLIGFKIGYDFSWLIPKWDYTASLNGLLRVNSIFMEPSHLAVSMAPAVFISLRAVVKKELFFISDKSALLIIICYILTFSIVAYIAILLSLFILALPYIKRLKHLLLLSVTILALFCSVYYFEPQTRMRVDDMVKVATGGEKSGEPHLTVYAYTSNAFVAFESIKSNSLFGRGLGSHPVTYDKFIQPYLPNGYWKNGYTGINKADANSLLLRLLSETGLFGVFVVFYFIFKFRLKASKDNDLSLINNAVLILLIMQLIRQGHYFYNGLFFFVWMYYFTYKKYHEPKLEVLESKNQ